MTGRAAENLILSRYWMTSKSLRVEVKSQVIDFIRRQSPESRHRLRLAVRKLADERGNIKDLSGDCAGYLRLSVGDYRIIFRYRATPRGAGILCIFAERRSVVYIMLERMIREGLVDDE